MEEEAELQAAIAASLAPDVQKPPAPVENHEGDGRITAKATSSEAGLKTPPGLGAEGEKDARRPTDGRTLNLSGHRERECMRHGYGEPSRCRMCARKQAR